ncbi:MAG TPA: hypothetical protein PLW97_05215 [Synergistaceae bacterium]|nr:hypothetical protein [Synergistaceae bacterium]HPQ37028.1 hypothetical protein [Synergistaceae bacterium]
MADLSHYLQHGELPPLGLARQSFPRPRTEDIPQAITEALERILPPGSFAPGARIAVTAGSRGISDIPLIHRTVVSWLRSAGAVPFLVPGMGSHGGGTAEGQLEVLKHLGITEESVGAPLLSSMDTVKAGVTPGGLGVYWDAHAWKADGVLLLNRIKPHTDISGPCESGLTKMMVIGLGKLKGALSCHSVGLDNMGKELLTFREILMQRCPLLGGLGILENAYEETASVVGLRPGEIPEEEPKLLKKARSLMGKILLPKAEILLIDRMGKDISGAGMDPNVIGRKCDGSPKEGSSFQADYIGVLDLSEASEGNASGMGMADFATEELLQKADLAATYANALTARVTEKLPMILLNHRQVLQGALSLTSPEARIIRLRDSRSLEYLQFSGSLRSAVAEHPDVEILQEPAPLEIDEKGNFSEWYPSE